MNEENLQALHEITTAIDGIRTAFKDKRDEQLIAELLDSAQGLINWMYRDEITASRPVFDACKPYMAGMLETVIKLQDLARIMESHNN